MAQCGARPAKQRPNQLKGSEAATWPDPGQTAGARPAHQSQKDRFGLVIGVVAHCHHGAAAFPGHGFQRGKTCHAGGIFTDLRLATRRCARANRPFQPPQFHRQAQRVCGLAHKGLVGVAFAPPQAMIYMTDDQFPLPEPGLVHSVKQVEKGHGIRPA